MREFVGRRGPIPVLIGLLTLGLCGCYNSDGPPLKSAPPPTVSEAVGKLPADATPEQKQKVAEQVKMAQEMYDKMHPKK